MTRAMLLGTLGSVLTLSACSLARVELTGKDAGFMRTDHDAGANVGLDAGAELDANPLPVDAFVPLDAPMVEDDAGSSTLDSGPPEPRDCDEIYGDLQNFMHCEETEHECMFYTVLNQLTCAEVCESEGGTCIEAYDNGLLFPCAPVSPPRSCDDRKLDDICVCSRDP
jgi:hypothetical protein